MSKVFIYKGKIDSSLFSSVKAMIAFGDSVGNVGIINTKHFSIEEGRKGFEQLKRWVSTGSFKCIVLSNFTSALNYANKEHILEWVEDHSSEPDFPTLILLGEDEKSDAKAFATVISEEDELRKVINT